MCVAPSFSTGFAAAFSRTSLFFVDSFDEDGLPASSFSSFVSVYVCVSYFLAQRFSQVSALSKNI